MACNESLDFQQAILHRSKPLSSFNVISDRALIPDASLSWLAFYQTMLLNGGYNPQRSHKGGKLMLFHVFSLTGMFNT